MAMIQERDHKSVFLFVGDLNAHHREWLNSITPTDVHGRNALDFCNSSGCSQLVSVPTHTSGNCLDLLLTDVSGVVDVDVLPPIGSSDHSTLSISVDPLLNPPDVTYRRSVFLKSRINWEGVDLDFSDIVWSDIFRADIPIEALNQCLQRICSSRIPSRIIRSRAKDKIWFNDACRLVFREKQTAYHRWSASRSRHDWEEYIRLRRRAKEIYKIAEREYHAHLKDILLGASQPHTWWSALKQSLFGVDSSLPPLQREDGSFSYDPAEKADLLAHAFAKKQCVDNITLPTTCFPEVGLSNLAFRSSELVSLLNDLDTYGGCDPLGFLPVFYKHIGNKLAPKLAVIFRNMLSRGEFPECWRVANVTPVPKTSSPSIHAQDYRPVSITPTLSKIYERLIAKRLMNYAIKHDLLPRNQFGFRKGYSTCDALLLLTHQLQKSLDSGIESRVVSLDFSAAFDRVNHCALAFKLRSMGVGGKFLNIISSFLSDRVQRVSLDGKYSSFSRVVSGVPQGSVLGPLLFILFTADMWNNISSKMIAYADDTSLFVEVPSPADRSTVAAMLNNDLYKISSWCEQWGMKLNPSKSHSMIISRSRVALPEHPDIVVGSDVVPMCTSIRLLGVTLDSKLTFESHLRTLSTSISRHIGLLRKCKRIYSEDNIMKNCFYSFILPHFEYCPQVWMSAAGTHIRLLDKMFRRCKSLVTELDISLQHRRLVSSLTFFFKILSNPSHPLYSEIPPLLQRLRSTRYSLSLNDLAREEPRCRTSQFSRCFLPSLISQWNRLPNEVVHSCSVDIFKTRVNRFLCGMSG